MKHKKKELVYFYDKLASLKLWAILVSFKSGNPGQGS